MNSIKIMDLMMILLSKILNYRLNIPVMISFLS